MQSGARSVFIGRCLPTACLILLLTLGYGLAAQAQNTIYTIAGGGSWSGAATGTTADIPQPGAVAEDAAGNVYVAVPSANNIFKIDTLGNLTVYAGLGYPTEHATTANNVPATTVGLNAPAGVALDNAGNVVIADTVNYMIRRVLSNGNIYNIAGNSKLCGAPTTACGDGGKATAAALNYPVGVASDAAGNIYIADTDDNRIRVVNLGKTTITIAGVSIPAGDIQTVAGNGVACSTPAAGSCGDGGPGTAAQLNNPQGVAVDAAGNIYISDSGDRRIRVVSTTGIINPLAGTGNPCFPVTGCGNGGPALSASFTNPWQIAVDSSANVFITDAPNNAIWEVTNSTQTATVIAGFGLPGFSGDGGPATAATLNIPRGVAVNSTDNVVIADTGNGHVRSFPLGGNINTIGGGGSGNDGATATAAILGAARGVALDSAGNLYIADTYNNRIREVGPSAPPSTIGTISTIVGTGLGGFGGDGGPALSATLSFPTSVALDSSGNIYIADSGNSVIREFNIGTGTVSVIAGSSQQPCSGFPCGDNGPATQATFAKLTSIALDSAGNVYAADAGTHSIRVVNMTAGPITIAGVTIQPGNIQTVAGTNGTPCTTPLKGNCGDGAAASLAQLNSPFGVAVDAAGDIFIADTYDNRIREVLASTGNIVAYAYTGGAGFGPTKGPALSASYNTPHYIALDPHGNLYVSGSDFDSIVERIDAVYHTVMVVVGVATNPKFYGLSGDGGLATLASINNAGVTVDGAGHLYIADDGNNRVREVLLTPTATPSVTSLNFPTTPVRTTAALSFTIANNGSDDLYISGMTVGPNPPFRIRTTTCKNNIVAPTGTCTITVTFTPSTATTYGGSITINDNAFGSTSQTVTLTGTGQ